MTMTAIAGEHNITIQKGADFGLTLTWKDENGSAVDLTGFTARMQIRKNADSQTTLASITNGNGITLGTTNGQIDLAISNTVTSAMDDGVAVYDLELVSSGNVVTRLLKGEVTITNEVTR